MHIGIIGFEESTRNAVFKICSQSCVKEKIPLRYLAQFASKEEFVHSALRKYCDLLILNLRKDEDVNDMIDTAKNLHETDHQLRIVFCDCDESMHFDSPVIDASPFVIKPYAISEIPSLISFLNAQDRNNRHCICLPDKRIIYLKTILYTECEGHHICFHLINGGKIRIRLQQNQLASLLKPFQYICAVSCGIYVNFMHVKEQKKREFSMIDGSVVRIPRRKCHAVRVKYTAYLDGAVC